LEINKDEDSENTDVKTIELLNKRFKEAAKYRETFEEEWKECEDFYNGKHWKDQNRSFKNLVFPLVEQEVSTLTDSLPSTDILARKPEREEDAKTLEASIHFTYEQQSFFLKLAMALRGSLKTGTAFHYVDFDPDADNGQGITTIKNIPWKHVYLDPSATEIDEAGFVGIKFPVRIEEAKRKHPKFADKISCSSSEGGSQYESTGQGLNENRANYGTGQSSASDKFKLEGMVTIEEAWLRDYTMVNIPESETAEKIAKETEAFFQGVNPPITRFEDHAKEIEAHHAQLVSIAGEALGVNPADVTEQDIEQLKEDPRIGIVVLMIQDHIKIHEQYQKTNPENKRPKYDSSLRLVIKIGNVIVYDGSPPVEDGMVPLVPYYCYKDEASIYGVGEVKNILPAQKSFNEMDHAEMESLHLSANTGWVIDSDCGVEPSSITNKRGKIYQIKPGSGFRRLEAGQVNPQLAMRKQSDQQFMQIITGMNEASQGRASGGITAARAIERLQQQTNGRLRLKSSSLAFYSLPRLGRLVASRNSKYWTTERLMRVTDNSTGQVNLIKFSPEQVRDLEYDVRVVQSSLAGTDKEAIADAMLAYVEKGLMPAKVYFQTVDVPNKKKILEALDEADQQKMMLQQLTQENEQLKAMIQQDNNGEPAEHNMPAEMEPQE
jgi:hypothetical protein